MKFKFIPQRDQMDCGPACLAMVAFFHGKKYPLNYLREKSFITREGVSIYGIKEAAHEIGLKTLSAKLSLEELTNKKSFFPCILHWNQKHFLLLRKIQKSKFSNKLIFHIADPEFGQIKISEDKFKKSWISDRDKGIALFLEPVEGFYQKTPPKERTLSIKYLLDYLSPYKKKVAIMFLLLLFGSILTLVFPFLTEALIDRGVSTKNFNFIFIVFLAQLSLLTGSIVINIFRNWLVLYIGTHISINIISEFLRKLLRLPIKFFDTKMIGDFNQRIQDNDRIEEFLTSQGLVTFFSIITFSVFFGVLWYYDYKILLIYLSLTIFSVAWSFFWLKRRKILDYYHFQQRSETQETIYEILKGVTEIKLNQLESFKRNEWKNIQQELFKLNVRILKVDQIQLSGFEFLNQLKNIIVTFLAATYTARGEMTLGALLSISYIIGEMNSPLNQLTDFFRSLQDAKLSLERLNEVEKHSKEENSTLKKLSSKNKIHIGIVLKNLSFQYEGPRSPFVLRDVNMTIPDGKVTAIVGASGSGKTTLMKLLLKFYNPVKGDIFFNENNILDISPKSIRTNTGVVMQDGFIFSDSIKRNIATSDKKIDNSRLQNAVRIANIEKFIDSLPLKYNTKIGSAGNNLSGGQKQRILIARAVYKNPQYIFFDEATSSLDAENESVIHNNLQDFFKGKTVLVIAHRLSTVKNADQIVVLKDGEIVEYGKHQKLINNKSEYYKLVKNQLELGN